MSDKEKAPPPEAEALVVALVKSVEIVAPASAVPVKVMLVEVNAAPVLGEEMTGATGAVVSGAGVAGVVAGVDWLAALA